MALKPKALNANEMLDIENFLSIREFHWEIKPFNIITGDMGSGKSLCIKLLYFFEGIFVSSILLAPGFSKRIFENGNFFERLSERFRKIFYLDDDSCQGLKITYSCQINGSNFTISVAWDDQQGKLQWESDYLKKKIPRWAGYFKSPSTPDMIRMVRNQIHEDIKHDFNEKMPISCMFVPASRAAIAVVGSNPDFQDPYLKDFLRDKDYVLTYPDVSLSSELANILKVRNIGFDPNGEADLILEHADGRKVPPLFSSSGQQELVYLLLLMQKLPEIRFNYGGMLSIFIEEPSAHLFPREQKELIESIVALFRQKKFLDTKFFITSHSPYVLNVLNNMLKRGSIVDKHGKNEERVKEIDNEFSFPSLFAHEVSATFIEEKKGTNMLSASGLIFSDKIDEIAALIDADSQRLLNFDYELERKGNG